jgi:hypothetical protein
MRLHRTALAMAGPLIFGSAFWLASVPAAAQERAGQPPMVDGGLYRADVPVTLDAPARAPDPALGVRRRFAAAYGRAKSPRIVIFWNREFTDQLATDYRDTVQVDRSVVAAGSSSGVAVGGWGVSAAAVESVGVAASSTRVTSSSENLTDNRTGSAYSDAVDFDIQAAFQAMLAAAGARLVDRTAIMRTTGQRAGSHANIQAIETAAVTGKADLILEIVQLDDPRKPDGVTYRVIGRNVRSGRIMATLSTAGEPPAVPMPLVAGPEGGFVRAVAPEPGPGDIGRQLAVETMAALTRAM